VPVLAVHKDLQEKAPEVELDQYDLPNVCVWFIKGLVMKMTLTKIRSPIVWKCSIQGRFCLNWDQNLCIVDACESFSCQYMMCEIMPDVYV
jgi:hypothetical protein